MDDVTIERVDGAQLLGFMSLGDTYATEVYDSMNAQELYYFLEPASAYRSVDRPNDEYIVSWRPSDDTLSRVESWRERGLHVPRDVTISEETLSLLTRLNAIQQETDDGLVTEMSLPPLDEDGLRAIKQELLTEHNLIVTEGYGVEPLRFDEEATANLDEIVSEPTF